MLLSVLPSTTFPLPWKQSAFVTGLLPKRKSRRRTKNRPQDSFCPLYVAWRVGAVAVAASRKGWVWWIRLSGVGTSTEVRPFLFHTLCFSMADLERYWDQLFEQHWPFAKPGSVFSGERHRGIWRQSMGPQPLTRLHWLLNSASSNFSPWSVHLVSCCGCCRKTDSLAF